MIQEPAGEPAAADAGRIFAGPESRAGVVRAAFGPSRRLAAVDRLRGGSKKGVYRLTLDDGATVIGYLWMRGEGSAEAVLVPGIPPQPVEMIGQLRGNVAHARDSLQRIARLRLILSTPAHRQRLARCQSRGFADWDC